MYPAGGVRAATRDDAVGIASVQVRGWRWAYRGLIPDGYLDSLSIEERTRTFLVLLDDGAGNSRFLVWEREGKVAGFVSFGESRDRPEVGGAGEIYAIYADPELTRQGIGSALLLAAESHLVEMGFRRAILWVLEGNAIGRRFYERLGWRPDGATKAEDAYGVGRDLREVRYSRKLTPPE